MSRLPCRPDVRSTPSEHVDAVNDDRIGGGSASFGFAFNRRLLARCQNDECAVCFSALTSISGGRRIPPGPSWLVPSHLSERWHVVIRRCFVRYSGRGATSIGGRAALLGG